MKKLTQEECQAIIEQMPQEIAAEINALLAIKNFEVTGVFIKKISEDFYKLNRDKSSIVNYIKTINEIVSNNRQQEVDVEKNQITSISCFTSMTKNRATQENDFVNQFKTNPRFILEVFNSDI